MTQADKIFECLEEIYDRGLLSSLRTDYSGRFMYGKKCVAIVPDSDSFSIGLAIGQLLEEKYPDEADELIEILEMCRYDNMGKREVIYFPSLQVEDKESLYSGDDDDE